MQIDEVLAFCLQLKKLVTTLLGSTPKKKK